MGASVGWDFKQMETRLNDPNWKSSVFSPPELKREAEYEMVRINTYKETMPLQSLALNIRK